MRFTGIVFAGSEQVRLLAICNPDSDRFQHLKRAISSRSLPGPSVLTYESLLSGQQTLESHLIDGRILRIESPGENFEVDRLLLLAGAQAAAEEGSYGLPKDRVARLSPERGRILHPRQWYLGFQRWLHNWASVLEQASTIRVMNHPSDISMMFDKIACQQLFAAAQIPIPESLGTVSGYDELVSEMEHSGLQRVMIKLAHGSSASGVIAFHRERSRQRAITTVELVRNGSEIRLYNSLKIRTYTRHRDIADLIDLLARERVQVERWLPKAFIDNQQFDLRIVMIGGRIQHTVVRQSDSPMTNLHLLNRRGSLEDVRDRLGDQLADICHSCQRVMQLFPRSLYAGIDVLISPDFRQHAVIEVNAFGDLLPGIEHNGKCTYGAEIDALMSSQAGVPG